MSPEAPQARGARVFPVPPPLYYGVGFLGGMLIHGAVPWTADAGARQVTVLLDALVMAAGLALCFSGVASVIWHRTTILPHRPVSALITVSSSAPTG